jgi:asparagine synthase (glutamine-hydrolysing)
MCGIAGIVWRDRERPAGLAEIRRMNHALFHRGPDGGGEYAAGPVALGHRRLSIIDLTTLGHQPMASDDGDLVLVFNGEIYNYLELREELGVKGVRFRSQCDTEVLLKAYEAWGPSCVERFNGMWAFAIHDRRRRQVFLSRDRFGIKPLCYVDDPTRFAFASEEKALLAAFPDLRAVNAAMLHHFLPSGAVDDGLETFFAGVKSLPPAHNMILDLDGGAVRAWPYWTVEPEAFRERRVGPDPVETLRGLLESAVRLQMRADVPVGTCLSGGIDSSALVCFMRDLHPDAIHTFSGLYKGKDYDEEEYVRAVRDHAGARGHDIRREPNGDLLDDLATITWHQDMPTAGPGLYTQFNVMERASRTVKVILDGQGADELFAGYLHYYPQRISDLLAAKGWRDRMEGYALMAQVARRFGPKWLSRVKGSLALRGARALFEAGRLLRRHAAPASAEPPPFHPRLAAAVKGREIQRDLQALYPDSLSNTLHNQLATQSIPALLHYEDRNSMAFSVEARVPFLDHRIVEFALGLPPEFKIRDSWTKWVLRKAAEPKLPATVTWRRSKLGYPTPVARWIRQGRDRDAFRELLFSPSFLQREVVSRESVEFHWNQHQSGAADRSWLLYRYATLELWFRQFVDRLEPRTARPVPEPPAASTPAAAA